MKIIYKQDENYPSSFLNINDSPDKIYYEGDIKIMDDLLISIVGSRKCSSYGEKMSKTFAREVVNLGMVTVSGLALGVDSFVHKESLNQFGKTIAVLPCGLKNIYPKENIELYKKIISGGGLIISEYEVYEPADSKKFIQRNRLISALGECLIITEAAYRSGTSVTARFAKEQGKKVFCVPSGLDNRCGIGTNKMIKNGAHLLSGISDIFEEVNNDKMKKYKEKYKLKKVLKNENKQVPKECEKVYNAIFNTATSIDHIFNQTKETIGDISYKLTLLELEGFIKFIPRWVL